MIGWFVSSAFAACPALDPLLHSVAVDLEEVHLDAVHEGLNQLSKALECGTPATQDQLATMWLYEGVTAVVEDDDTTARDALRAVARLNPLLFKDIYGSQVRGVWDDALAIGDEQASVSIQGHASLGQIHLDGLPASQEQSTVDGLHTVQVTGPNGGVVFGKIVFLAPNENRIVRVPWQPPAPAAPPSLPLMPPPEPTKRRVRHLGWLATSGLTALGGGAAAVVALRQNASLRTSTGFSDLDRTFRNQRIAGGVAYGLAGVSVVSVSIFAARQF